MSLSYIYKKVYRIFPTIVGTPMVAKKKSQNELLLTDQKKLILQEKFYPEKFAKILVQSISIVPSFV